VGNWTEVNSKRCEADVGVHRVQGFIVRHGTYLSDPGTAGCEKRKTDASGADVGKTHKVKDPQNF
jgi:hypothetical protein